MALADPGSAPVDLPPAAAADPESAPRPDRAFSSIAVPIPRREATSHGARRFAWPVGFCSRIAHIESGTPPASPLLWKWIAFVARSAAFALTQLKGAHDDDAKEHDLPVVRQGRGRGGALLRRNLSGQQVAAVHKAPGDYPGGKEGDVLTVEFTVLGIPCIGLNGGPAVQAQRGLLVPDRDRRPGRDRPLLERDRRQWRPGKRVRLVQGPLGPLVADHPARADRGAGRGRRRGQARVRGDDADEEDRRRRHRGGAAGLTLVARTAARAGCFRELS